MCRTNNANQIEPACFWRQLQIEVCFQCETAFPALWSMVLTKLPWMISLRFVGSIGSSELAAAALATTLCNVTGLSLSVGLSSAMTTLTSQVRGRIQKHQLLNEQTNLLLSSSLEDGAINYNTMERMYNPEKGEPTNELLLPLVVLYRGMVIQILLVLPVGLWWICGVRTVLLLLGQDHVLSTMTEQYLRILSVGLWAYSINWTLTSWLQAVSMADVPAFAAAGGLLTHIPFNLFFVALFGYLGCAVATVAFQLLQPVVMLLYLFGTNAGRTRVLDKIAVDRTGLSFWPEMKEAIRLSGIRQYLGLALPGIVMISEWWASELCIFWAGRLSEVALGSLTIYQTINTFCFMFPVSFSIAGASRVGNLLGAGRAEAARFAGAVSVVLAGSCSALLGIVLYTCPHDLFPRLFAPNETDLVDLTSSVMPLLAVYVLGDGIQTAFNGLIKGTGQQVAAMPIVLISYWVVGLPISYYLAFHKRYSIVGLGIGLLLGTYLHMVLFGIVLWRMNWKEQANKAQARFCSKNVEG